MYAKLVNGALQIAPTTLTNGTQTIYNPSVDMLKAQGYKEVIETPMPDIDEDNPKYYEGSYVEQGDKIVKVWTETEPPTPTEPIPTVEDRLTMLENKQFEQESFNTDVGDALVELADIIAGGDTNG